MAKNSSGTDLYKWVTQCYDVDYADILNAVYKLF